MSSSVPAPPPAVCTYISPPTPSVPPPPPPSGSADSPPPPPPPPPPATDSFFRLQEQIEEAIICRIQEFDPDRKLRSADAHNILGTVANRFLALVTMKDTNSIQLDDKDYKFIETNVWGMVRLILDKRVQLRFRKGERVVCNVGDEWLSGSVAAINEDNQREKVTIPYVVKLDPPGKLISAPVDDNDTIRAEVCFGHGEKSILFTLFCLPLTNQSRTRRFKVGERVACAVEDSLPVPTGTVWVAGTVQRIDVSMEEAVKKHLPDQSSKWPVPCVPYQVKLDSGHSVLVHRDEHWLIRDLTHQTEGMRQAADGSRCLTRIEKRQRDGSWEMVDHQTRRVRVGTPPDPTPEPDDDICKGCTRAECKG